MRLCGLTQISLCRSFLGSHSSHGSHGFLLWVENLTEALRIVVFRLTQIPLTDFLLMVRNLTEALRFVVLRLTQIPRISQIFF